MMTLIPIFFFITVRELPKAVADFTKAAGHPGGLQAAVYGGRRAAGAGGAPVAAGPGPTPTVDPCILGSTATT